MPSNQKAAKAIFSLLPQEAKVIVDLGSGFGTLLHALAIIDKTRKYVGLENSWIPYLVSKLFERKNLQFYRQDFFTADLKEYDVLLTYLCPSAMNNLKKKLKVEQLQNKLLISNTFSLPNSTVEQSLIINDWYSSTIYLYKL